MRAVLKHVDSNVDEKPDDNDYIDHSQIKELQFDDAELLQRCFCVDADRMLTTEK